MTWRAYRRSDATALRAAHARQCAAAGDGFAFPDLDDPSYLMVAVAERDGVALGAVVAHATVEVMFVGGDTGMVRDAMGRQGEFAAWLRRAGASEAHAFVPRAKLRGMEALLRRCGFRRSNENFVPFYREL